MPRRAHIDDVVDPTRARLAALASAPPQSQSELPTPRPSDKPDGAAGRREGQGGAGSVARPQRRGRNYLTVNRKVMIAEDEAERFADATVSISAAFGSQVTYSQITRARIIERRMARALFGVWGRPVAIGLLISLGIFAGSWGLTRFPIWPSKIAVCAGCAIAMLESVRQFLHLLAGNPDAYNARTPEDERKSCSDGIEI